MYIGDPGINRKSDHQIDLLTGNQTAMGIIETINMIAREEGLEKGAEQKSAQVVKNLLMTQRFTDTEIASFAGVTDEFIRKIKQEQNP